MNNKFWKSGGRDALLYLTTLAVPIIVTSCAMGNEMGEAKPCQTTAIVKDLRGLDGCGYVLVLPDGTQLEPLLDESQPEPAIKGIKLRHGMRITLSYTEQKDRVSICMAGKIVEVTCLGEMAQADKN